MSGKIINIPAFSIIGAVYLLTHIFPIPLPAQTPVSGTITGATWTKINSPYEVTGDITVQSLTIEPGVEVRFQNNYQFNISGRLTAVGSKQDSIRFNSSPTNVSGWRGLLFAAGSANSAMASCIIEDANSFGVRFENSITRFDKCRITNSAANGIEVNGCKINSFKCIIADNSGYGVLINSHGWGVFRNCIISENNNRGIYTDSSKIEINNSLICYNTMGGVRLSSVADTLIMLNSNVVYNPSGPGIVSFGGTMNIKNSIVYFNDSGIGYSGGNVNITYCDIQETTPADNNISQDPLFEETSTFTLVSSSPCIDRGNITPIYDDVCFPPSQRSSRNDMGIYGGPGACGWYEPLYIVPSLLNFGNVTVGDTSFLPLTIKNYSDSDLTVDGLTIIGSDAPYFDVDTNVPFSILPFDSVQIMVYFLPQQRKLFSDTLTITSGMEFQNIPLSGNGVVPHISATDSLNFQNIKVGDSLSKFIEISNEGLGILKISSITTSNPIFSPRPDQLPWFISPFQIDTLSVLFKPDSARSYLDSLIIFTNDPHPNESRFRIMTKGIGLAPVLSVLSDSLNFGSVLINDDSTARILINNVGNDTLLIMSTAMTGPDSLTFSIVSDPTGIKLPPGSAPDTITIKFQPDNVGLHSAVLRIESNDPFNNPQYVVLQGVGVKPELVLNTVTLNFGQVQVTSDSVLSLIVTNSGSASLEVKDIEIIPDSTVFTIIAGAQDCIIDPNGTADSIQISFSPLTAGIVSAVLQLRSNDPDYDTLQIPLTGRGVNFEIAVTPDDSLGFAQIPVGGDSTLMVLLENLGSGDLQVRSHISGVDSVQFRLGSGDSSFIIPENLPQHEVQVIFAPVNRGTKNAVLEIFSNDTDHPSILISLSGYGLAAEIYMLQSTISFNNTYVWENNIQSVSIFNQGELDLIIDSIRITGPDSIEFMVLSTGLPLVIPVGPDSQVVPLQFNPLYAGDKNAWLGVDSNDPSSHPQINLNATALLDMTPATIAIDTSTLDFTAGSGSTMHVVLKDNESIIQSVLLFAKPGGKKIYQQINLAQDNDTLWTAVIPAQQITERGMEYYLEARHGGVTTSYPQNGAAEPEIGIVRVAALRYPYTTLSGKYQMISLPVQTGEQKLSDLFQDDLGTYASTRYRLFDWNSDSTEYIELSALDSPLPPGKALWLITKDAEMLNVENAQSTLCPAYFRQPLKAGWNMIAVPFAFTVAWDQIDHSNIQGNTLWYYNGDSWDIDSSLVPYRGYAVQAITDTVLYIPAQEADTAVIPKSTQPGEWQLQIIAQKSSYHDFYNYAGIRMSARDTWDIYDISEPPEIGNFVSLYFQTDTSAPSPARLAGDFRESNHERYSFSLTLISNFSGQTRIQIIPYKLPDNFDWVMLSTRSKIRYPKEIVTTDLLQESFQLMVGTKTALQPILNEYREIPGNFHIAQNFPNPFNPSTTIIYQLPQPGEISIDIFDILGKKVRSLLPKTRQEAGYYQLHWDGKNDRHEPVASAIYILYLRSEKYQHAIKMILQR